MASPRLRLGQLLVDARMLTQEALDQVLVLQKEDGRRIGILLVEKGLINETQLTQILSHQLSIPWVSLLYIEFSRQLLNLVPQNVAEKYCLVPIYVRHVRGQGETLYVAMDNPSNEEGLKECSTFSGLPARAMIAPPTDIRNAIRVYYAGGAPKPAGAPPTPAILTLPTTPAPVVVSTKPLTVELPAPAPPAPASRTLPEAGASSSRPPTEAPAIETREIQVNPKAAERLERLMNQEDAPPASEREVKSIPQPKGRSPRMVALTLLDGTTITLPAKGSRGAGPAARRAQEPKPEATPEEDGGQLTARDLVAALRAVAHGADASDVLGPNPSWEPMFAALLSLLLKKHIIPDWEFVEELIAAGGLRRATQPPSGSGENDT